mgnify:CR=1 FL=1
MSLSGNVVEGRAGIDLWHGTVDRVVWESREIERSLRGQYRIRKPRLTFITSRSKESSERPVDPPFIY